MSLQWRSAYDNKTVSWMDLNTIDDGFLGGEDLLVLVNMEHNTPTFVIDNSTSVTGPEDQPLELVEVISIENIEEEEVAKGYLIAVQMYVRHGTLTIGNTDGLSFIAGNGQEDTLSYFKGKLS